MQNSQQSKEQVIKLTKAWVEQVVVGLNLCPFAAPVVRSEHLLAYQVYDGCDEVGLHEAFLSALDQLQSAEPEQLETLLLVVPCMLAEFEDYLAMLDYFERLLKKAGLQGELQIASFHPQYQFAGLPADDITHWTNRSPYPTFHLLREKSLEQAIAAFGDTEKIPERNMRFFEQQQAEGLQTLFPPFADYAVSCPDKRN